MRQLRVTKMVAAGNDFIVIDCRDMSCAGCCELSSLAKNLCRRKTDIGADGLLVLEKSNKADFRMRIFNPDGSEAEMCGNGLRCAVIHVGKKKAKAETIAGIYEAEIVDKDRVKIKMEEPKDFKLNFSIMVNHRHVKVNCIDAGVPHAVIFVQGLEDIDVESIGRKIRHSEKFKPRGTNVDFVEIIDDNNIKMRTYERGVEGETLACGTGAVASAIISGITMFGCRLKAHLGAERLDIGHLGARQGFPRFRSGQAGRRINVHAKGGILKVYFRNIKGKIKDVYLEGEAKEVFSGDIKPAF